MSVLDEFAERFGRPQSAWTKEQWRQAATELASRLDREATPAKRGRPPHDDSRYVRGKNGKVTISAKANYAAFAWQVEQRMEQAEADGRPLTIKDAMRAELVSIIRRHNNAPENLNRMRAAIGLPPLAPSDTRGERDGEIGEYRLGDEFIKTAYRAVRELLKKWREEREASNAGDQKDTNAREAVEAYARRKKVNIYMRKRH